MKNEKILKIKLEKKPSNLLNTLRVFLPRHKRLTFGQKLPAIELAQKRFAIDRKHFENFKRIVGEHTGDRGLKFLYPMTLAYPLEMKILSHKIMPISMFRLVNIRKHVILHRPFKLSGTFDIRCVLDQQRFVPNGMEIDLYICLHNEDNVLWECIRTYYLKGRFGSSPYISNGFKLPALAGQYDCRQFIIPKKIGLPFSRICGDTNGIHYWNFYARLMGYRRGLAQPVMVLAKCFGHLKPFCKDTPYRMDVLIKGPVYYDEVLSLCRHHQEDRRRFDLYCSEESRPCLQTHISKLEPGSEKMIQPIVEKEFNMQNLPGSQLDTRRT